MALSAINQVVVNSPYKNESFYMGGYAMGFRLFSGAVLAIVLFFAMRAAGLKADSAIVVSLVPLISGVINLLTGPIFTSSALAGVLFLILPLLPVGARLGENIVTVLGSVTGELKSSAGQHVTPATSASSQLASQLSEIEGACNSGALAPSACGEAKRQAIQQFSQSIGLGESPAPRPATDRDL